MTNFHVVAGLGDALEVLSLDDRSRPARLIAGNPRLDLALLDVEGGDLSPAPLGDSARLRVGDLVFAVGNPWGQRGVVTAGIVSGLGELERQRGEDPAAYIRSDVRLAPGNSGGPLVSAQGEVIGINAMIFGGDLSVAIPSHVALDWAARLPAQPVYLGLGVQPADLPAPLRGGGQARGLLVAAVANDGPARAGGLLVGDLLLRLDGAPLERSEALVDALAARRPGDRLRLEIARGGAPITLVVTVAQRV
jgi:serine protease Do